MSDRPPTGGKPVVFLRDYQPPDWRVSSVALEFDLGADETIVSSQMVLEQAPGGTAELHLDGEELELLEVRLDGRVLAAAEVQCGSSDLTIPGARGRVEVATRCRIRPDRNSALSGLYRSGQGDSAMLLTQCEAEGFRRITYFVDRPDVLATYRVTLRADRIRYPVLLSNGNLTATGDLPDGRHFATFEDPFPKPSYLFAVAAGRLESIESRFVTAQGRPVRLVLHASPGRAERCRWALESLETAMRWDERRFGRCYDLDVFHVVAADDFTMGAMENKGLNIFNSKYLLADPDTATDDDYRHILAVVGHEYLHNWSGNRVTLRDWFQLSLKEGLTVYREQEFEADSAAPVLRRIEDVRTLWRAQFREDAGPLAHPVQPPSYSEINNFYTATVYEKGAEIIRMLAVALGRAGFRRGLDLYFDRHDGQAVTIEDLVAALGEANGRDLSPWLAWYRQAGTPELKASFRYVAGERRFDLTLAQSTPPTPGQHDKQPLPIPVAMSLFDADGHALPLQLAGESGDAPAERVVVLDSASATFNFTGIDSAPAPSLLRGFSAPVRLVDDLRAEDLAHLARHDTDGFNRWFAADRLARILFAQTLSVGAPPAAGIAAWAGALRAALADPAADAALVAEMLTPPDEVTLGEGVDPLDPAAVHAAREALVDNLAVALEGELLARWTSRVAGSGRMAEPAARRLRNACLGLLARADVRHLELARRHHVAADNLTDRLAALVVLVHHGAGDAEAQLASFADRYREEPLVLQKWFSVQATRAVESAVETVASLTGDARFHWANPNDVYALLGAFALRNPVAFHRADGAGYRLVSTAIARLDAINPQVAARLAPAFGSWRRLEPVRRDNMRAELERLASRPASSADLADIVTRTLGG